MDPALAALVRALRLDGTVSLAGEAVIAADLGVSAAADCCSTALASVLVAPAITLAVGTATAAAYIQNATQRE